MKFYLIISFLFCFLFAAASGKRRSVHKRVGFKADPPGLLPGAYLSPVYISFNTFIHSFISARGLFGVKSALPSESTYVSMMNSVIQSEQFKDREELAHFMAHALFLSRGFTLAEVETPSLALSVHSYHPRGYCPMQGEAQYHSASLEIFGDDRLLVAPELVAFDEEINWRCSIIAWKRLKAANATLSPTIEKIFQILRSYYLLK